MSIVQHENPCGLDTPYFYQQKLWNVDEEKCLGHENDILLVYTCNVNEQCVIPGPACGYFSVACSDNAYRILQRKWAETSELGSYLLSGFFCFLIVITYLVIKVRD